MTIGQDHRLDDAKENERSGRRTREGSTHGGLGRGRRVCEGTVRAEQETRPRRESPRRDSQRRMGDEDGPHPRKTGDEKRGRGSSAQERCATDTTPENVAQRTPSPRKPSQGHQAQEMPNHGRGVKRRTGPLRANGAIASQEQSRTSRIPSASAPKVKHCGHA